MPRFSAADLRRLGQDLFTCVGVPSDEAALVADHMVESGLLGHDSHSVLRFPQYTDMVRSGKVVPGASLEILREHDSVVQVNGNWNYGPVTATRATELAIERVKDRAMSIVTVRGCNHVARLGRFVHMVAEHEHLIGNLDITYAVFLYQQVYFLDNRFRAPKTIAVDALFYTQFLFAAFKRGLYTTKTTMIRASQCGIQSYVGLSL